MSVNFKDLISDDVLLFINEIAHKSKGYDVYLGGGYLRDLYHNNINGFKGKLVWEKFYLGKVIEDQPIKPKDIDLFFVPNGEVVGELPISAKMYINYDVMAEDIPNVRENVKQVRGVFMKELSTCDIQFIVYDKPLSIDKLAEDMDCNINQVMYHPLTDTQYLTVNFIRGHKDKVIEMIHEFEHERMFGRIQRMMKKFPDYSIEHKIPLEDWDYLVYKQTQDKESKKSGNAHAGSFIEE